jgi:hypothetical protein
MTGNFQQLIAHIRGSKRKVYCVPVAGDAWDGVKLGLELAQAEFAALPVEDKGWLVITNYPLSARSLRMSTFWEALLLEYLRTAGSDGIVLSEGWGARAHEGFPEVAFG